MARVVVVERLREMGFKNIPERREWLSEHNDEILDYYREYGKGKTMRHFHIGTPTFMRISGVKMKKRIQKEEPIKPALTFEDIVSAAPNTAMLGQLMLDGITTLINELREELSGAKSTITQLQGDKEELKRQLKNMTENRERIMREYNEKILKGKVLTIDQTKHILVPAEKGR